MTLHQILDYIVPEDKRSLGWILMISFLAHVGSFFFFQIENPAFFGMTKRPVAVTLWSSDLWGREGGSFEMMAMRLSDPSSIALPTTPLPEPSSLRQVKPDLGGTSLVVDDEVFAKPVNDSTRVIDHLRPVEERASAAIFEDRAVPMPIRVETPPSLSGSRVRLGGELRKLPVIERVALPRPKTTLTLRHTVLEMGVNSDGVVEHANLDRTSGDSELDNVALRTMRQWRFAAVGEDSRVRWGKVEVYWDLQD